jgi:hypothetical protein
MNARSLSKSANRYSLRRASEPFKAWRHIIGFDQDTNLIREPLSPLIAERVVTR